MDSAILALLNEYLFKVLTTIYLRNYVAGL